MVIHLDCYEEVARFVDAIFGLNDDVLERAPKVHAERKRRGLPPLRPDAQG